MTQPRRAIIHIGTSGIAIPVTKADFPEEFKTGSRLHYYGTLFNTLEINSSFYKIPLAKTFEKWSKEVPDNFKFTVKCWKGITHAKNLDFNPADIDKFMDAILPMGKKAGCILIQFPASITVRYLKKVESILAHINEHDTHQQWQPAIELRHISWYCDTAYKVFQHANATVVFHDMPGSTTPLNYATSNFRYLRFHGPLGDYKGNYSPGQLDYYGEQIEKWSSSSEEIYVYFNNTIGNAFLNARSLTNILSSSFSSLSITNNR